MESSSAVRVTDAKSEVAFSSGAGASAGKRHTAKLTGSRRNLSCITNCLTMIFRNSTNDGFPYRGSRQQASRIQRWQRRGIGRDQQRDFGAPENHRITTLVGQCSDHFLKIGQRMWRELGVNQFFKYDAIDFRPRRRVR